MKEENKKDTTPEIKNRLIRQEWESLDDYHKRWKEDHKLFSKIFKDTGDENRELRRKKYKIRNTKKHKIIRGRKFIGYREIPINHKNPFEYYKNMILNEKTLDDLIAESNLKQKYFKEKFNVSE